MPSSLSQNLSRILAIGVFLLTPIAAFAASVFASGVITVQNTHVISCHVVNVGTKPLTVTIDVVNVTAAGAGTVAATATPDLDPNERGTASFTATGVGNFFCRASIAKGLRGSMQVNDAVGPIATLEMR